MRCNPSVRGTIAYHPEDEVEKNTADAVINEISEASSGNPVEKRVGRLVIHVRSNVRAGRATVTSVCTSKCSQTCTCKCTSLHTVKPQP